MKHLIMDSPSYECFECKKISNDFTEIENHMFDVTEKL